MKIIGYTEISAAADRLRQLAARTQANVHSRLCVALRSLRKRLWPRIYKGMYLTAYGVRTYIDIRVPRSAAQFSFFMLMTLFPLIICINWVIGLLNENANELLELLGRFLPSNTIDIFADYIEYVGRYSGTPLLVAGIIMLVAPSAAAARAIGGILRDIRKKVCSNGLVSFILSYFTSLFLLVFTYSGAFVLFTGNRVLRYIVDKFKLGNTLLGWNWLRFLVLFVMICTVLFIIYRFSTFDPLRPRDTLEGHALPGALFSSVVIVAVSILFSWFISLTTRYSLVYGSLAALIILMLWMYTTSIIIIIGGIFNMLYDEQQRILGNVYIPHSARCAVRYIKRSITRSLKSDKTV